jgi:hypothetical protein
MTRLFKALTTNDTVTTNGMVTNSTSSNYLLDMFFRMGGSRQMDESSIQTMFLNAYHENPEYALKALFYNRDIRGGQGERRSFRLMFQALCIVDPSTAIRLINYVPEYGRWDDLFVAFGTDVWESVTDLILSSLKRGDKLCAKWMPRPNKAKAYIAKDLAKAWGLSLDDYRDLIVKHTDVVETLMCKREWTAINYNHVPSKASHQYRGAYLKHDEDRYREWLGNLTKVDEKGKPLAKVNAGAIFPHDVIKPYFGYGNTDTDTLIEAQWKALPEYAPKGNKVISVCDVSGSMNGLPLLVCLALGIYTAERNNGIFKNGFITFSERPALQILKGKTLRDKVNELHRAHWDMNTNLEAVFELLLTSAKRDNLSEEDMPDTILILSDMQFDACVRNKSNSAIDMIKRMYSEAGYNVPNVIFWNLNTGSGIPVKYDTSGTAVVSGFSPSILKSIISGNINPIAQMMEVLNSERYSKIN